MPTINISEADEAAHFRACWDAHVADLQRTIRPDYILIWPERLPVKNAGVWLHGVPDEVIAALRSRGCAVKVQE